MAVLPRTSTFVSIEMCKERLEIENCRIHLGCAPYVIQIIQKTFGPAYEMQQRQQCSVACASLLQFATLLASYRRPYAQRAVKVLLSLDRRQPSAAKLYACIAANSGRWTGRRCYVDASVQVLLLACTYAFGMKGWSQAACMPRRRWSPTSLIETNISS